MGATQMSIPTVRRGMLPLRHLRAIRRDEAKPYRLCPRAAAVALDGRSGHHGPIAKNRVCG